MNNTTRSYRTILKTIRQASKILIAEPNFASCQDVIIKICETTIAIVVITNQYFEENMYNIAAAMNSKKPKNQITPKGFDTGKVNSLIST